MVAMSDLSVMLFPWGAKNPQVSEIGAAGDKWQRDPRLGAFTFVYVAEKEADFQTMLPRLRDSVAFVDPNTDAMGVTVSGSPERLATLPAFISKCAASLRESWRTKASKRPKCSWSLSVR